MWGLCRLLFALHQFSARLWDWIRFVEELTCDVRRGQVGDEPVARGVGGSRDQAQAGQGDDESLPTPADAHIPQNHQRRRRQRQVDHDGKRRLHIRANVHPLQRDTPAFNRRVPERLEGDARHGDGDDARKGGQGHEQHQHAECDLHGPVPPDAQDVQADGVAGEEGAAEVCDLHHCVPFAQLELRPFGVHEAREMLAFAGEDVEVDHGDVGDEECLEMRES